jgi:hypothetical protein
MNLHEAPSRRLILLAPCSAWVPTPFRSPYGDRNRYHNLLRGMQRLRGQVYVQDGAISPSSLVDGCHQSERDGRSWHLLVLNAQDRICGCARYYQHPGAVTHSELTSAHCALARTTQWSSALCSALKAELAFTRDLDLPCVELGGWALNEEIRGTTEALRMALGTYAFWQMLGGAICLSTVTRRNCASSILRRIGGRSLAYEGVELPPYYDPQYNCEMELLKFYSWAPNPRYAIWIDQMKEELRQIPVIARPMG